MVTFPMWIRHGGKFERNLQYLGGKLVEKFTSTVVGCSNFVEIVCSFLKIDCNKLVLHMKFNPDIKEMID